MKEDLRWWGEFAPGFNGQTLIPCIVHEDSVWTEALIKAFGAICGNDWLASEWDGLKPLSINSSCHHICSPPRLDRDDRQCVGTLGSGRLAGEV